MLATQTVSELSTMFWLCAAVAVLVASGLGFAAGLAYAPTRDARIAQKTRRHAVRLFELNLRRLEAARESCVWLNELPGLALNPHQHKLLSTIHLGLQDTIAQLLTRPEPARVGPVATAEPVDWNAAWLRTPADPRTLLPDRSAFETNLATMLEIGGESGLLLVKMDRSEHLQRRFGSKAAQHLATKLAELICGAVRTHDLTCRYNADTFAVLLPGIGRDDGSRLSDSLRQSVRRHRFRLEDGPEVLVTASFGYTFCGPGDRPGLVLDRALDALSRAEKLGRNQLHVHDSSACLSPFEAAAGYRCQA